MKKTKLRTMVCLESRRLTGVTRDWMPRWQAEILVAAYPQSRHARRTCRIVDAPPVDLPDLSRRHGDSAASGLLYWACRSTYDSAAPEQWRLVGPTGHTLWMPGDRVICPAPSAHAQAMAASSVQSADVLRQLDSGARWAYATGPRRGQQLADARSLGIL